MHAKVSCRWGRRRFLLILFPVVLYFLLRTTHFKHNTYQLALRPHDARCEGFSCSNCDPQPHTYLKCIDGVWRKDCTIADLCTSGDAPFPNQTTYPKKEDFEAFAPYGPLVGRNAASPSHENSKLAVVFVVDGSNVRDAVESVRKWGQDGSRPCEIGQQRQQAELVFFGEAKHAQRAYQEYAQVDGLSSCFTRVQLLSEKRSSIPTLLQLFEVHGTNGFKPDFVFILDPSVTPVRNGWLKKVKEETHDASYYWVKGTIRHHDNTRELRYSHIGSYDHTFFALHPAAIYNFWDPYFRNFTEQIHQKEKWSGPWFASRQQRDVWFSGQIAEYVWGNHNHVKLFLNFFVYSNFLLNEPRPFLRHALSPNTFFVVNLMLESECSTGTSPSGKVCDFQMSYSENKNPGITKENRRPTEPRLAIVMPYTTKQVTFAVLAVGFWHKKWPCSEKTKGKPDLILQGPSVMNNRLLGTITRFAPVSQCFRRVFWRNSTLPPEIDTYEYGPPVLFFDMMSSDLRHEYDYVYMMEPDTSPLTGQWLDRVYAELEDSSPFWVKGNIGVHFDESDAVGGTYFMGKPGEPLPFQPIGPRILHINGNGIYNLWDDEFALFLQNFAYAFRGRLNSAGTHQLSFERKDRVTCRRANIFGRGVPECLGSFDTSLADFLFYSRRRIRAHLHLYRWASFFINNYRPKYLQTEGLPGDAVFLHKLLVMCEFQDVHWDECRKWDIPVGMGELMGLVDSVGYTRGMNDT